MRILQVQTTALLRRLFRQSRIKQRSFSIGSGAGIGLHNVQDRIRPASVWRFGTIHNCQIIGAPMTFGQPYVGTDVGPEKLLALGLASKLRQLDWHVCEPTLALQFEAVDDKEEKPAHPTAKNVRSVGAGTKILAETVHQTLTRNHFPLILGGDHSIGIGSLAGILRHAPDTGILWIDAHADLNTPGLSESGNLHGMPIGLLMKDAIDKTNTQDTTATLPGLEWLSEYPQLSPNQIVYIGLRDVDEAERRLIRDMNIKAFTMTDIDRYGIGAVMEEALLHLKDRPLHLSYDIDAVDPQHAPATGTAVRGGLTFREAHYVAEAAALSQRLRSAEMVELNPNLSNEEGADNTVELGLHILLSLMGKSIL